MDLADLELLISVGEVGSFRRAAQMQALDVATLSRRIARLENELGVLLFERGHVGVKLTVAGISTSELARKAITDIDAIRRNAAANGRAERGRLRLGTHLSTIGPYLCQSLGEWRGQHPDVAVDLTEADDRTLLSGLRQRELSAVICFCLMLPGEIASHKLCVERLLVALPAAHPLTTAKRILWRDLRSVPLLVQKRSGSNACHEHQARLVGPGADFRPQATGGFNLFNLVATGVGAITMSCHQEMVVDGVVLRPIDESDAEVTIVLAWNPSAEEPVMGSFVAFMRDRAKNVGFQ